MMDWKVEQWRGNDRLTALARLPQFVIAAMNDERRAFNANSAAQPKEIAIVKFSIHAGLTGAQH